MPSAPRIYTRRGDQGNTDLRDARRVSKASPLIHAIGDIDELNACIGVLRAEALPAHIDRFLHQIQNDLFGIGAKIANPQYTLHITAAQAIEAQVDALSEQLPALKHFILPSGTRAAALCQQARTLCRRAERAIIQCDQDETIAAPIDTTMKQYINRLSDYLFVAARALNQAAGRQEVRWQ